MSLYANAFRWILEKINVRIRGKGHFATAGVLDIFGFENFEVCIIFCCVYAISLSVSLSVSLTLCLSLSASLSASLYVSVSLSLLD